MNKEAQVDVVRHRTTAEARQALSNFCKGVGTAGDRSVHIFSIPVDRDRDADCILSDVIAERDALLKTCGELLQATIEPDGKITWSKVKCENCDTQKQS